MSFTDPTETTENLANRSTNRLPPNGLLNSDCSYVLALQIYIDNGTYKSIVSQPGATAGTISRVLRGKFALIVILTCR